MVEALILLVISGGGSAIVYLLTKAQERTDSRLSNIEQRLEKIETDKLINKPVLEKDCTERRSLDIQKRNQMSGRITKVEAKMEYVQRPKINYNDPEYRYEKK